MDSDELSPDEAKYARDVEEVLKQIERQEVPEIERLIEAEGEKNEDQAQVGQHTEQESD